MSSGEDIFRLAHQPYHEKNSLIYKKNNTAGFISYTVKCNTSRKEMNVVFLLGLKMVVETTQDRTANTCGEDVFSLPT